jgi:UDP-N-acetyl-D-mannosaminuronic acid dehydrogenase
MKDEKIAVFGLGHMGLPTAALLAFNGFTVNGVARDSKKIDLINKGISPIEEPGLDGLLKQAIKKGNFQATNDGLKACQEATVFIVLVPTPADDNKNSDLTAVRSVCETISQGIKKDDLVIIESTVPPGTCQKLIIPILEKSGLKAGEDFKLAFSPERAIPKFTIHEITHNARVIGGIDTESTIRATDIYSKITEGEIVQMNDLISAEMVKLVENTYRDLNIALANEIAVICETLGIDAIDIIRAANYHPRVNIHTPGPGVGGHCLPIDPYFIVEKARINNLKASLILMAREVNESMPAHVIELVDAALNDVHKSIKGSKIGILGFAYKGDVADVRESPAIPVINKLLKKGAKVVVHDPFVPKEVITAHGYQHASLNEVLESDCVVLITDHQYYKTIKPEMIKNKVFVCTHPIFDPEDFEKYNFSFKGIGRGNKT